MEEAGESSQSSWILVNLAWFLDIPENKKH